MHPETAHGGDRKSNQVENISTRSFAQDTAEKTGQTDRIVRMHAERGEKVTQEAIDLILTFKGAVGPRRVAREAGCSPPERQDL